MKEVRADYHTSRWTFQRARRSVFVAAIAVFAAACGSDSPSGPGTPPPAATPIGKYAISTLNGKALPVALAADTNYKYEVTVGTFALTSDGKYSAVITYRQTIPDNVSIFVDSTGGTWALTGTAIQFTNSQDGSKDNAVWSNDLLTFVETDGKITNTWVYKR
ncbi:MAG: hypothetical protein ABJF01_00300 [bacterium]